MLSRALDFHAADLAQRLGARTTVITGGASNRTHVRQLTNAGIDVVVTPTPDASEHDIHRIACARGYRTLYSIAGPEVLHTLLAAGRIDRLYLTFALRLIAGHDYDTLTRGHVLAPPLAWRLHELYFESFARAQPGLLYTSIERAPPTQSGPV